MTIIAQICDADLRSPLRATRTVGDLLAVQERIDTLNSYLASGTLSPEGTDFVLGELDDLRKEKTAEAAAKQS